ncbi:MAG: hypothetical protein ABIU54_09100, partial [Candidatus Eisenbacteria bacterium]
RVALQRFESVDASDIWIADLERGVATRFTDELGTNEAPLWSPDGTRIAYGWSNNSAQVLKIKSLVGDTVATFLESDPLFKRDHRWSPDGQNIIYSRLDPSTQWDIWVLPLGGDRKPFPYLRTRFSESNAEVSPDGRWLLYQSDESGQIEVYVQSFPVAGGKYQVTNGGGTYPTWSRDGRQIYYGLNSDPTHAFEADVQVGGEFRLGPPRVAITPPKDARGLMLAHTGKRFLALLPAGNDPVPSITVVLDGLPKAAGR